MEKSRRWWRVLSAPFAQNASSTRARLQGQVAVHPLEDRCLLTTSIGVPVAEWPVAELIAGPSGDLWYRRVLGGTLGHVSSQGSVAQFTSPLDTLTPQVQGVDASGNLWFRLDEFHTGPYLGRLTPSGNFFQTNDLSPVLPRVDDLATPPATFLPTVVFNRNGDAQLVGVRAKVCHPSQGGPPPGKAASPLQEPPFASHARALARGVCGP